MTATAPATAELWAAVDRIVGEAPALSDLRAHGLHLIAARRWRELGRPVGATLRRDVRIAAVRTMVAPAVLERARAAYDGPMALMKGPEVAARHRDPALRPFRDLDLLVADPAAAQRALLSAGFEGVGADGGAYDGRHHLQPLAWPGTPLLVEVHRRPEWPAWSAPPSAEELLAVARPAAVGVDGLLALPPAWHAVALAAHSWSDAPLRRVLDLLDVQLLAQGEERAEAARIADGFGLDGIWRAMTVAGDALLGSALAPLPLRLLGRDVRAVRDSTVLENHVRRLLSPFWVLPPRRALRLAGGELAGALLPAEGERWSAKTARSGRALGNAFRSLSDHHAAVR
jgi:hypothetical protein